MAASCIAANQAARQGQNMRNRQGGFDSDYGSDVVSSHANTPQALEHNRPAPVAIGDNTPVQYSSPPLWRGGGNGHTPVRQESDMDNLEREDTVRSNSSSAAMLPVRGVCRVFGAVMFLLNHVAVQTIAYLAFVIVFQCLTESLRLKEEYHFDRLIGDTFLENHFDSSHNTFQTIRRVADVYEWGNHVLIPGLFGNAGPCEGTAAVGSYSAFHSSEDGHRGPTNLSAALAAKGCNDDAWADGEGSFHLAGSTAWTPEEIASSLDVMDWTEGLIFKQVCWRDSFGFLRLPSEGPRDGRVRTMGRPLLSAGGLTGAVSEWLVRRLARVNRPEVALGRRLPPPATGARAAGLGAGVLHVPVRPKLPARAAGPRLGRAGLTALWLQLDAPGLAARAPVGPFHCGGARRQPQRHHLGRRRLVPHLPCERLRGGRAALPLGDVAARAARHRRGGRAASPQAHSPSQPRPLPSPLPAEGSSRAPSAPLAQVIDFRQHKLNRSSTREPGGARPATLYHCVRFSWNGEHLHQLCDPNDPATGRTLGVVRLAVEEFFNDLKRAHWIDHQTRAMSITLPFRSNHLAVRSRVTLLLETTATGAVLPSYDIETRVESSWKLEATQFWLQIGFFM